jgi:ABC-2 type transport system permease protein
MNKIWLLTKVQLGTALDFNIVSRKTNAKSKNSAIYIALLIFSIFLAIVSFAYSYAIGTTLKMIGFLDLLPELLMAVTCIITLITTIYKVKGTLFGFKDYDIVMSLPAKTADIVASRLILLYIINIVFTLIVMVPNSIAYGILAKASPIFYVISIVSIFFIPLVPMIVATIIGTIIALVSAKFRHSSLINLLINIALIIGIFYVSTTIDSEEKLARISTTITNQVDGIYPLAKMYRMAVCDFNLLSILLFLSISILTFIIFSIIIGNKFKTINSVIAANYTKGNYKVGDLIQASPFRALYRKELKRFFSSSLYVMNTAIGMVMMTIGAIATLFMSPETLAQVMETPGLENYLTIVAPLFISMCVAMTYITACSISLEGKNLWILKASPIKSKTIFNSKIAVNLTITIPPIILDSIIIGLGLKLSIIEFIILLIMPITYAFFTAILGLHVNLKLPNMNWTTEVTVIKQSAASMVALLAGMIAVGIPIALIIVLSNINTTMLLGLITIVLILITIGMYQLLITKGSKILGTL